MRIKQQGLYRPENEHDACGVGFVVQKDGIKSHEIIEKGLQILVNLRHRGATGADSETGDGAGITVQVPHLFFKKVVQQLPDEGDYGVGMVFLPQESTLQESAMAVISSVISAQKLTIQSWRTVPIDSKIIGQEARKTEPLIKQVFIVRPKDLDEASFERKLYIVRKLIERAIYDDTSIDNSTVHIASLSCRTIVYKGMLLPEQVLRYFNDLHDSDVVSSIALVHSRFSTNTFPTWDLAQPFRLIAHNGEINTIKGNIFWMQAREALLKSDLLNIDIQTILPVIEPNKSDSLTFDNMFELLVMSGRSIPHALMMLVPESWNDKNPISNELKAFYEYHASFMEPWDGPAAIAFTDGRYVGATLDRNGLRPARYVITKDGFVVFGSEIGVQSFNAENIEEKGRLCPGKLLLIDTDEGKILYNDEIKQHIATQSPYLDWVSKHCINLKDIPQSERETITLPQERLDFMHSEFGYDIEESKSIIAPMCMQAKEPTGSMGNDTPLAILSYKPQRLFNYFKQLFAQVTNPAIDPIREVLVMSLTSFIGSRKNLLSETEDHCRSIKFINPILTNSDRDKLKQNKVGFKSITLDIIFDSTNGPDALKMALDTLCDSASKAIQQGVELLILSDRKVNKKNAPIPSLLATAALQHYLVNQKIRSQVSLIIETAEARSPMHFALLFGYGADAINPYLVYATIYALIEEEIVTDLAYKEAEHNYIQAIQNSLLKILSKMGISTLRSYRGAQLFEAVGLDDSLVNDYFCGTTTRIKGLGIKDIAKEVLEFHSLATDPEHHSIFKRPSAGNLRFRKGGEFHAWNPETVRYLQRSVRTKDVELYKKYAGIANDQAKTLSTIRGLFNFNSGLSPIPIEDVEPVDDIVKRFTTGAMSFGALSKEAHESLAIAMNKIGGRSNSGEGGEEVERFTPREDGSLARSAIKQVASGRFGVTAHYLVNADELQIKISQGAKPGEGGQLPGHKVDSVIAKVRYATPGVSLISPPPHHDIYSIEDLAQLIFDLKNVNSKANISVKLVSEIGVGTVASGVVKAYADLITISGYSGGTGASPISSIKDAGLPWELGLAETHQTLLLNNLRGRVTLQVDGGMRTGRDVIIAALLGAEEYGFSTAALISIGCVMVRECHLNTCPTGVATQDPELRKKFKGIPDNVIQFLHFVAEETRELMAELGVRTLDDIIGKTEYLNYHTDPERWKTKKLDLSAMIEKLDVPDSYARRKTIEQKHQIHDIIDRQIITDTEATIASKGTISLSYDIRNSDRSVGAMLSGKISTLYGLNGLKEDSIKIQFSGSAGQSFGAFLAPGITFTIVGDTNDYVGKGLSGGKLIIYPPKESLFEAAKNVIIGNTTFYGATAGEAYINGLAGERFCIRNSGAITVVEGAGDHCCEYMTGGRVIVLGPVGRNFAAGMSGGIAYVYDPNNTFSFYCNQSMVELSNVKEELDEVFLRQYIERHYELTKSKMAFSILEKWANEINHFIKILPLEYKEYLLTNRDIEVVETEDG